MRNAILFSSPFFFAGFAGCGPTDVTYSHDVRPLLEEHCLRCHAEGGVAGIPLERYDEVAPMKELIVSDVEGGVMPPWLAEAGCEDYADDPSLSDAEKALLRHWMEIGAPEGEATAPSTTTLAAPLATASALSRVDLELAMAEPYAPRLDLSDDYRCFLVDWPEEQDLFVTGLGVVPGDTSVVHHVITYVVHPEDVPTARASDDLDPGPGWGCFGGPEEASAGLGGWAPGSPAREYPAGTGISVPAGSALIFEVHYHAQGIPAEDTTSVVIKLDPSVEKEAEIIPVTNPAWTEGRGMLIPAGDAEVTHIFRAPVSLMVDKPFVIYDVTAHMHRRGVGESLWIERENGDRDCVLEVPRWDFDWQLTYVLAQPKVVNPGDTIGIGCTFDNSAEHQPPDDASELHDVAWGEGTGDEMCLGFYYVTFQ